MREHVFFAQAEHLSELLRDHLCAIHDKREIGTYLDFDIIKALARTFANPPDLARRLRSRGKLNPIRANHALAVVEVEADDIGFPARETENSGTSAADHDGRLGDRLGDCFEVLPIDRVVGNFHEPRAATMSEIEIKNLSFTSSCSGSAICTLKG